MNLFTKKTESTNSLTFSGTGLARAAPAWLFGVSEATSMFQTGGKPSTWVPPVGLVDLCVSEILSERKLTWNLEFTKTIRGKHFQTTPYKNVASDEIALTSSIKVESQKTLYMSHAFKL